MSKKRKLIEVALPLDAINAACKADKDRKTGTLRNLHKWFAPMPLPAWRALLFAALVDDPEDEQERDRLFSLIERLVAAGGDLPQAQDLIEARERILECWPDGPPIVVDPFCGGGSTLVEAQRLGCSTVGSDLNPVPVLITKTLTELLPKVAGTPSLNADETRLQMSGGNFTGFLADVAHYAGIVRERAWERLADFYPDAQDGGAPIAWLWCHTVRCPNPACGVDTPLVTSWHLSRRKGDERWISPVLSGQELTFVVSGPHGVPPEVPKSGRGANFVCVACGSTVGDKYIAAKGQVGQLSLRCMAAVDRTDDEARRYRSVTAEEEQIALGAVPADPPLTALADDPRNIWCVRYGLKTQADLYTPRQLVMLEVFAGEIASLSTTLDADGASTELSEAVTAVLGLAVGKLAQSNSRLVRWKLDSRNGTGKPLPAFAEQTIKMPWDFAEAAPFADASAGSWLTNVETAMRAVPYAPTKGGTAVQADARHIAADVDGPVFFATDPPYFDQIVYADLSDYFYVWLRRALRSAFPSLFATVATPKQGELVALAHRHDGDKARARQYFVDGFTDTFRPLATRQSPEVPILVVYAFREQSGSASDGEIAPGWEAILEALIAADLMIVGTWPIHGTGSSRMIGIGTNALATYVVLVCRPRPSSADRIMRADLVRLLRRDLAGSISELQHANIAPVDLAQAVIGPGMELFSRHSSVVETDGSKVRVADALRLINRTLSEVLDEQEGDLDPESRWAVTWYEQHGFGNSEFGSADQLARAKGIAVDRLVQAGIVRSGGNSVALLRREDLAPDWDPARDRYPTAWEAVQYLARELLERGEVGAASLYARLRSLADPARELSYRLFTVSDKAGRKEEAIVYNSLVASWPEIARLSADLPTDTPAPEAMF